MSDDPRRCGSGTCIIDTQGRCWCGQQWDGHQMCHPAAPMPAPLQADLDRPDPQSTGADDHAA